jgi:hypothetical protein
MVSLNREPFQKPGWFQESRPIKDTVYSGIQPEALKILLKNGN